MFSFLGGKKKDSSGNLSVVGGRSGNLNSNVQRSFARGVDCNMKIVLKGDRNTGKSCLLQLLQGAPFQEQYTPTPEIEVGNISWKYKMTDDVVKVEVWDVVDVGKKKDTANAPLKFGADGDAAPAVELPALDAKFVNVYKGTHGVIMVMDMTKPWTFQYVERELPLVPKDLPVLVLNNFRDKGADRQVNAEVVSAWAENLVRSEDGDAAPVFYAESSLKNGFGLMFVYRFLNLPYLRLQKTQLLARLAATNDEMNVAQQELELSGFGSEEQDFNKFLTAKTERKKNRKKSSPIDPDAVANEMSKKLQSVTPPKGAAANTVQAAKDISTAKRSMFGMGGSRNGSRRNSTSRSRPSTPPPKETGAPVKDVADFNPADSFNLDEYFGDDGAKALEVNEATTEQDPDPPTTDEAPTEANEEVESDDDDTDGPNMMMMADGSDVEVSDVEIESGDELNQISDVEESEEEEEDEPSSDEENPFETVIPKVATTPSVAPTVDTLQGDEYMTLDSDPETETSPSAKSKKKETKKNKKKAIEREPEPPAASVIPPRRKPSGGLSFVAYGAPTVAPVYTAPVVEIPVETTLKDKKDKKEKKKKNKKGDKDKAEKAESSSEPLTTPAPVMGNNLDSWLDDEDEADASTAPPKAKKEKEKEKEKEKVVEASADAEKKKKKKKKKEEGAAEEDNEEKKKKKKKDKSGGDDGDGEKKKKKKKKKPEENYESI